MFIQVVWHFLTPEHFLCIDLSKFYILQIKRNYFPHVSMINQTKVWLPNVRFLRRTEHCDFKPTDTDTYMSCCGP